MFRAFLSHHQGAHNFIKQLNIDEFVLYDRSLIFLGVVNLFCLLGIAEFHILHSLHCKSITTIQTNKCTQFIRITLIL